MSAPRIVTNRASELAETKRRWRVLDVPERITEELDSSRTRGSKAPAATPKTANRPPHRSKRPLIFSVGFILASAIAAVQIWNENKATVSTVAVVEAVEPGTVIERADLKLIESTEHANNLSEIEDAVGAVARNHLAAGDVVTRSDVAQAKPIPDGRSLIGLSLGPGEYPTTSLSAGDTVDVFVVDHSTGKATLLLEDEPIHSTIGSVTSQNEPRMLVSFLVRPRHARALTESARYSGGVRLTLKADR